MGKALAVLAVVLAAFAFAPVASAERPYAGLTRAGAIKMAKDKAVAAAVGLGGMNLKQAAKFRRQLDALTPAATKTVCKGSRAWKVVWKRSDPIYVNRGGIVWKCTLGG